MISLMTLKAQGKSIKRLALTESLLRIVGTTQRPYFLAEAFFFSAANAARSSFI
jgi:hypothetical protein